MKTGRRQALPGSPVARQKPAGSAGLLGRALVAGCPRAQRSAHWWKIRRKLKQFKKFRRFLYESSIFCGENEAQKDLEDLEDEKDFKKDLN